MRRRIKMMLWHYLSGRGLLVFFSVLIFLVGMTFGFLGVEMLNPDQQKYLQELLVSFWSKVGAVSVDASIYLQQQIGKMLLVLILVYVFGLTVIGLPFLIVPLFIYGFMLGFTTSFLLTFKGFKGLLFAVVSLGPQNLIYVPVLLVAVITAMEFSWSMVRRLWRAEPYPIFPAVARYSAIMLVLSCLISVGGIVETFLVQDLIKWLALRIV